MQSLIKHVLLLSRLVLLRLQLQLPLKLPPLRRDYGQDEAGSVFFFLHRIIFVLSANPLGAALDVENIAACHRLNLAAPILLPKSNNWSIILAWFFCEICKGGRGSH